MTTAGRVRPQSLAPRPSALLIVALVISGVLALLTLAAFALSGGLAGFGLSALLGIAPLPVLLAAVLALDRLEPEPRLNLIVAFVWGAGTAVVLAIVLTLAGEAAAAAIGFGQEAVKNLGAVVMAPLIEEGLKGAVLLLLLRRRSEIDGLTDGIIYAALSGLGFAAVENIGYYLGAFQESGAGGAAELFVLRGVIDPIGHPVYTAMIGIGVAYAATRRGAGRFAAIPLGYLAAVFLHGLWNGMATLGSLLGLVAAYVVVLVACAGLIVVTVRERRQLVAKIGYYLPAYGPTGLVSPQDVTMLGSLPARRAGRKWSKSVGYGKAMADYQQAATELAMLHQRAEREHMDVAEFAGERDALLGVMAASRRW